jgi:DNA-binding beta-propeller fold protein YncE
MTKIVTIVTLCFACCFAAQAQTDAPLTLSKTIPLPGVVGGFDHFAIDLSGGVLFAAAKDNHTVEAVNLQTGKIAQNITGLAKPHGLAWVPETHRLYVADGKLAQLQVYEGSPLHASGTLKLSDDADDMVYDEQSDTLYVGHGGSDAANPGRIAVINTKDFSLAANLPVAAHPEALDIDQQGQRVFANIADAGQVAVVNIKTNAIEDTWKLKDASDNTPLAYDAQEQMLLIACRKPAVLLALDANTGKEISRIPTGNGADDLFHDSKLHRVYVITGSGAVDVYSISTAKHFTALGKVRTASGAKTGLFVPSQNLLYIGIPGIGAKPAEIRVYQTNARLPR